MTYLLRFALTLIALLTSFNSQAGKPKKSPKLAETLVPYENKLPMPGATLWLCAYDGKKHIECRLAATSQELSLPAEVDSRLPRIVDDILNAPQVLAEALVRIPLHTAAFDMNLVGQLAEAVMCGAKLRCSILFGENYEQLAQIASPFLSQQLASQTVAPQS